MKRSLFFAAALTLTVSGCGGGVEAIAEKNRTFYALDTASKELQADFETPYPPLDKKAPPPAIEHRGVTVLNGKVHLSRPTDWVLRSATNEPGRRFVQYVSPKEYIFAIYEWPDLPDAPWREVLDRYEKSAQASHAELVSERVPIATWNTQGRAYVVRRKVPGPKTPYVNMSREFLARSENRIVLVQIVHQGETLAPEHEELMRVIETLELL